MFILPTLHTLLISKIKEILGWMKSTTIARNIFDKKLVVVYCINLIGGMFPPYNRYLSFFTIFR